jgi:WD40 repeat protein
VFSGSDDGTIRVWSGDHGTHLHTLMKHNDGGRVVCALAVMRDGTLVSGGWYYVENEGEGSDDEDGCDVAELKMW